MMRRACDAEAARPEEEPPPAPLGWVGGPRTCPAAGRDADSQWPLAARGVYPSVSPLLSLLLRSLSAARPDEGQRTRAAAARAPSAAAAACDGRQRVAMRRGACVRVDSDWLLAPGSRCERNPSARAQVAGRARASSEAAGASLPRTRADGTTRPHPSLPCWPRSASRERRRTDEHARRVVAPSRRRAVVRSRRRVVVTHGGRRGTDGGHTSRRRVVALSSRTGEGGEPTSTRVASSRRRVAIFPRTGMAEPSAISSS